MQAEPKKKSKVGMIVAIIVALALGLPCVIGILAAIAIPAFVSYIRRSKTSEATSNLHLIASQEESYCTEHSNWLFPAGPVPAAPTSTKQLADFASDPTFAQLGVAIADPVYYSYSIRPSPNGAGEIDLVAHGDLDADGNLSTFTVHCGPGCTCTPDVEKENESE